MKSPPVLSIVTPSLNQGRFIERTIQNVLGQGYSRLEYIVQDGASSDETGEILQRYQASLAHCESVKDTGQAQAVNLGFRHATGTIMAYLNADDVLLPHTLHYVARFFARHSQVDVVYGHRVLIDADDREIGRWVMPPHDNAILSWADYIPQETLFWRRRIWDEAGGAMDEDFQFALDWDLLSGSGPWGQDLPGYRAFWRPSGSIRARRPRPTWRASARKNAAGCTRGATGAPSLWTRSSPTCARICIGISSTIPCTAWESSGIDPGRLLKGPRKAHGT